MKNKSFVFPMAAVYFAIMASGAFYEEISCILSLMISAYLIFTLCKKGALKIRMNYLFLGMAVLCGGYAFSSLWAVDRGMAFLGFIKYLPLLLFFIAVSQNDDSEKILFYLPYFASALALICAVLMQIPSLHDHFSVADRFAGSFQYPNSFAIFLLIAELLLITKEKIEKYDYVFIILLFAAILYTGSRTVFVLSVLANIFAVFLMSNKKIKVIMLSSIAGMVCIALIAALISKNDILERFLNISIKESTFIGRFLYFRDALPLILKHPFGIGYSGYYYMQPAIQSGVYSVRHIHNDILQIFLDTGWIPAVFFIISCIKAFLSKKIPSKRKLILAAFLIHSMFDFNSMFIGLYFIFILLADDKEGKEKNIASKSLLYSSAAAIGALSIYFFFVIGSNRIGKYDIALRMYPCYTDARIAELKDADSAEKMDEIADIIIDGNKYISVAYSAKAKAAYSKGDFKAVIENKKKVFDTAVFGYEDYEDYCIMLINGINLYRKAGDEKSAAICLAELGNTISAAESLEDKLSALGKLIKDQPQTEIPAQIKKAYYELKD